MDKPWEKDPLLLHYIEAFLNGNETFRSAMIQAFIAGQTWRERRDEIKKRRAESQEPGAGGGKP